MRRFAARTPIRSSYRRKNGTEVWLPIQDWTEAEPLTRYAAGMRRKRRTQNAEAEVNSVCVSVRRGAYRESLPDTHY